MTIGQPLEPSNYRAAARGWREAKRQLGLFLLSRGMHNDEARGGPGAYDLEPLVIERYFNRFHEIPTK